MNWICCPKCESIILSKNKKAAVNLKINPVLCEKNGCNTEMIPIIIPPTFFKNISNPYLEEIRDKTENVLKQAKNLYFCGYSFPDADIHIKYLLKRAEINRDSDLNVYVLNRNITKELKERYRRFFKSEICFIEQTFEDFCENVPIKCENNLIKYKKM